MTDDSQENENLEYSKQFRKMLNDLYIGTSSYDMGKVVNRLTIKCENQEQYDNLINNIDKINKVIKEILVSEYDDFIFIKADYEEVTKKILKDRLDYMYKI